MGSANTTPTYGSHGNSSSVAKDWAAMAAMDNPSSAYPANAGTPHDRRPQLHDEMPLDRRREGGMQKHRVAPAVDETWVHFGGQPSSSVGVVKGGGGGRGGV